jgi:DNA-binding transcriptional ArsR family regulator
LPDDVDSLFTALGDPTRRRLLDQLSTTGPLSATALAADHSVSRQAVVKHLGTLAAAGLLETRRQGREVLYDVVPGRLDPAVQWMAQVGHHWDERLDALRQKLSTEPKY